MSRPDLKQSSSFSKGIIENTSNEISCRGLTSLLKPCFMFHQQNEPWCGPCLLASSCCTVRRSLSLCHFLCADSNSTANHLLHGLTDVPGPSESNMAIIKTHSDLWLCLDAGRVKPHYQTQDCALGLFISPVHSQRHLVIVWHRTLAVLFKCLHFIYLMTETICQAGISMLCILQKVPF